MRGSGLAGEGMPDIYPYIPIIIENTKKARIALAKGYKIGGYQTFSIYKKRGPRFYP